MRHSTGYLIGYDIGSSSVKVSVLDASTGKVAGSAHSPAQEMKIFSPYSGWAEQHPETWWEHAIKATKLLFSSHNISKGDVAAIGISYQMHGLVAVDQNQQPLRPSIIWCDSRASEIGSKAFKEIGEETCLRTFLNSPGNFTASKLKWVKEHEPHIYEKIFKVMLPGDFIAMKMTGDISTSVTGLSESILWDYEKNGVADTLLDHYNISEELLPEVRSSFEISGELTRRAAEELGLLEGIPVAYRAGDQPNNAFSLNVLSPGEAATTAGTSGVIYGVTDEPVYDKKSRVNTFVHVNNRPESPRFGVLLCINGTGILYNWLRQNMSSAGTSTYSQMNKLAAETPVGSDGVTILPFGNGAERILENKNIGAQMYGIDFNRHNSAHLLRAAQEGIVFAMNYGFEIMKEMGMKPECVKAGEANMFLSPLFREAFVNTTGTVLELYSTDGAQGAARGAGVGAGIFTDYKEAFGGLEKADSTEPVTEKSKSYGEAYQRWVSKLESEL